jgi:MFS family permease
LVIAALALLLLGLVNRLHGAAAQYQIGLLVAPLVFTLGFMNAIVSVAAQTVLQEHTTESTRGKVFGALGMMINIAATLPIFFAGILADIFGVPAVIFTIASALLIFALLQYWTLHRRQKLA